jgi:hypothetical protein
MADPKDLASQLSAFNAIEAGEPWYKKQLPMEGRATFLPFRDTMEGSVFNKRELALPGFLAGALNAFTSPERARTSSDPTFNAGEEAANFALNTFGGGIATGKALRNPTGQGGVDLSMNAWHGSPHHIEGKFDIAKVGTGEGNQAYGHGMYYGGARGTGEQYQKALGGLKFEYAKPLEELGINPKITTNNMDFDANPLNQALGSIAKRLKTTALDYPNAPLNEKLIKEHFDEHIRLLDDTVPKDVAQKNALQNLILKEGYPKIQVGGNLYKVDIPDEQIPLMLNWDETLNKQPQAVKDAFRKLGISVDEKANKAFLDDLEAQLTGGAVKGVKEVPNPTGESLYNKLVSKFGLPEAASRELNKLGVSGIRYLDEGSRSAGKGTSNFVVFKPETVKILEKNDVPVNPFNVEKTDVSSIFGQGAQQLRYTDPNSGGFIKVVQKPDGTASVLGLEVPKEFQGTGIGKKLQAQIMADFPAMEGQVSSKAAAKNAYDLGRRPMGNPNASLKDVLKMIDEDTSVNMVSPDLQKLRTPPTRKELLQQEFDKLNK